jgi:hypothetical protein
LPRDGATSVPTNATLTAHYASPAVYDGEAVVVEHTAPGASDTPREPPRELTGDFDENEGLLAVTPDAPLAAGDEYTLTWPRLHGSDHAGEGRGGKVSFRAGTAEDTESPAFAGFSNIAWDVLRVRDDCTDSLEDRFAFDLGLRGASDDGGRDSLELVVFQRGRSGAQGVEVLHVPIPERGETVRIERALEDARGSVCFSGIVRDLTGRASSGDAPAVCTTTVPPPFFYGCRVSRPRKRDGEAALIAVFAVGASLLARRRRRD